MMEQREEKKKKRDGKLGVATTSPSPCQAPKVEARLWEKEYPHLLGNALSFILIISLIREDFCLEVLEIDGK